MKIRRIASSRVSASPPMWRMTSISPSVHGQGIAREGCEAALAWLDANLGPIEVPAIINIGNEPSMKLAERLGFVRQPDGTYKNEPIAVFRRPARRV
jgi:RimJ/RimL family protein N-acetyltransferase